MPTMNHIVCVHGVSHHYHGYASRCWAKAIRSHCHDPSSVSFHEVNWNRRYGDKQAHCDCPFPTGWLDASELDGFGDLGWYIGNTAVREQAIEDCLQTIGNAVGGTIHVLGHSLGSVIAYQALHRCSKIADVASFVSVGSPLNWGLFRPLLTYEIGTAPRLKLRRPPVDRWTNIMDTADFVYRLALGRPVLESFDAEEDVDKDITKEFSCDDCCPGIAQTGLSGGIINAQSLCAHLHFFNARSPGCQEVAMGLGITDGR